MFPSLPGFWSGFGVSGNATFQASRVDLKNPLLNPNERMQNAPDTLLNLSLLYDKYNFSSDLSWHYSSDYVAAYGLWGTSSFGSPMNSSALDQWVHAHQQLDLNLAYNYSNKPKYYSPLEKIIKSNMLTIFKDINIVNVDYRPFNAADWPLTDCGLLGPVTLAPVAPGNSTAP